MLHGMFGILLNVDRDGVRLYKTMNVDDFIHAIIQHVPDRQFKMIVITVLIAVNGNQGINAIYHI